MTNKARRVTPHVWKTKKIEQIVDNPNGTHMLVPVEAWKRVVGTLEHQDSLGVRANSVLAEIGGEDEEV